MRTAEKDACVMAPIYRLGFRPPLAEIEEDDAAATRRSAGLIGIAITLALLVAGLFLIKQLHHSSMIEDCLLTGRTNCDVATIQLR
jgi:hypothetical protein